jgi:hypothetical protein
MVIGSPDIFGLVWCASDRQEWFLFRTHRVTLDPPQTPPRCCLVQSESASCWGKLPEIEDIDYEGLLALSVGNTGLKAVASFPPRLLLRLKRTIWLPTAQPASTPIL